MDQVLIKYYEFILGLNYVEMRNTNEYIVQEQDAENVPIKQDYAEIPLQFRDEKDYINVLEPLFCEETKANIIKCMETENYPTYQCNIAKGGTGVFQQFDLAIVGHFEQINSRDLILFMTGPLNDEKTQSQFGIVEHSQEIIRINLKFAQNGPFYLQLVQNINDKLPFYIKKVTALTTLEREYRALHKVDTLALKQIIFSLLNDSEEHNYFLIPEKLDERLRLKYNQSQYDAIRQTLKTQGITLIQGPPGTGKTKTVIGTVSVLLSSLQQETKKQSTTKYCTMMELEDKGTKSQCEPWFEDGYDDWRDHIFDDVQEDLKAFYNFKKYVKDSAIEMKKNDISVVKCPEKILVCGPSNSAVDEIVKKVLQEGLLDENGIEKQLMIVRIGENYDPSIQHVSLEGLVNQRMFEQKLKDDEIGKVRKDIIAQAKIIFGTLSAAGSNVLLMAEQNFDTVIIDEAAQAVEISTLIPLQYGCKRLVLIGDHNQLPATVFSKVCEKFKYDQSLFERMEKQGAKIHMLKVQYRMHPHISSFISETFYKSELMDAPNLMELVGQPDFYKYYTYSPIVVLHVRGYEQFTRNSYQNPQESEVVTQLVMDILKKFPKFNLNNIGIVSPYSQQIWHMQKELKSTLRVTDLPLEVKTVDGFQGREKDIIIFSTVRSKFLSATEKNPKKGIGFLNDPRRMNVSLSRCRQCLIVVCDIYKISVNKMWRGLIEYAQSKGTCYKVDTDDIGAWFEEFDQNPLKYQTELKKPKQQAV